MFDLYHAQVKGGLQDGAVKAAARSGGILSALVAIGKEEGVGGFWKGNLPQVIAKDTALTRVSIQSSLSFAALDNSLDNNCI